MHVIANSIADAWFKILYNLKDHAYRQDIQRGSFAGGYRLQLPWMSVEIDRYDVDVVPIMPEGGAIPAPTTHEYIQGYAARYLLGTEPPEENEVYTYASRIETQLPKAIKMLKSSPQTNQASIIVGRPEDLDLEDPACLRAIDFKVVNGRLDISVFFRSWDIWAGLPTNLGGLAILAEYVATMVGVETGSMFAASPGAHIYHYQVELVEARTGRVF